MEPMNLGSPNNSPAANTGYLPSFLMGEQAPTTPRNTLSPNKAGRNISFTISPLSNSPQDYNRSALTQKTLFGAYNSPAAQPAAVGVGNFGGTPLQNHNASLSGPPTQGLFDTLRHDRTHLSAATTPALNVSTAPRDNSLSYAYNTHNASNYNDSYVNNNSFNNTGRNLLSPLGAATPIPVMPRQCDFWVTVFGFPASAAATILQHFSKCGTILDKVFPAQNGNWVHIKYSSRLECDKALNFNEKIIGNIMIGVTQCREQSILDKENMNDNRNAIPHKVRPLTVSAYQSVANESAVIASPNTPQRSTGIMNKAMDLLFGW